MRRNAFETPPFKGCGDPECAPCAAVRAGEDLLDVLETLNVQIESSWRAQMALKRACLVLAMVFWALGVAVFALLGRSWGWW